MIRTRHLLMGLCLIVLIACAGCKKSAVASLGTPTPISGWEKFVGIGVEIWLPERYVAIDPNKGPEAVYKELETTGSEFAWAVPALKEKPEMLRLITLDPTTTQFKYVPNLVIGMRSDPILVDVTIDRAVPLYAQAQESVSSNLHVLQQGIVELGKHRAGRFVLEYTSPSLKTRSVLFLIKDGAIFWELGYTSATENFDRLLPEFEQSARTFVIQPRY